MPVVTQVSSPNYNRSKYYSKLQTETLRSEQLIGKGVLIEMPLHMIEEQTYRIAFLKSKPLILKNLIDDGDGKHGSLVTIFSSWNAMVGTGMVTVPWAFQ